MFLTLNKTVVVSNRQERIRDEVRRYFRYRSQSPSLDNVNPHYRTSKHRKAESRVDKKDSTSSSRFLPSAQSLAPRFTKHGSGGGFGDIVTDDKIRDGNLNTHCDSCSATAYRLGIPKQAACQTSLGLQV